MKKTMKKAKMCRQPELVDIHLTIAGADGSPEAGGLDIAFVESVTGLGVGNYKVTLKDKAQRNLVPVAILSSTANAYGIVTAVDKESITIQMKKMTDGTAIEADLSLHLLFSGSKYLY